MLFGIEGITHESRDRGYHLGQPMRVDAKVAGFHPVPASLQNQFGHVPGDPPAEGAAEEGSGEGITRKKHQYKEQEHAKDESTTQIGTVPLFPLFLSHSHPFC